VGRTRRIPFVLNVDDPVDAAIWEALEPMLTRRRASQFIRGAVAHALGIGGLLSPVVTPALPAEQTRPALPSGAVMRAKRPTPRAILDEVPLESYDNGDDLDQATDNFLSMFG
jgi:hypothetical protein